jgi:ribosome biogenesis GTPase / thiamine phosphate phosphatase
MKGLILRSTGSFYDILADDGKHYNGKVRGKIRLEGIKETNPVAVGDYVEFQPLDPFSAIESILPRKNHILRQSVKKTGHAHVLAANVDQVLLVATMSMPRTSVGFIDRFLVAAESFRIPQVIAFNKKDLLSDDENMIQQQLISVYEAIGVRCFSIKAIDDKDVLLPLIQGKVTLVAGHSGVGKSTLLNAIAPELKQKTAEISDFSEKGMHTTTFAEMFQLNEDTFVIDTPGVKEWGLVDMEPQEISDYFPEMRERRLDCKFGSRCLHVNEPKCAIIEDVKEGKIALTRYESYISMVLGEDNRK